MNDTHTGQTGQNDPPPQKTSSASDSAVVPGGSGDTVDKPSISRHPVWLFVVLNIVLVLFLIAAGAIAMKSGCIPNRGIWFYAIIRRFFWATSKAEIN